MKRVYIISLTEFQIILYSFDCTILVYWIVSFYYFLFFFFLCTPFRKNSHTSKFCSHLAQRNFIHPPLVCSLPSTQKKKSVKTKYIRVCTVQRIYAPAFQTRYHFPQHELIYAGDAFFVFVSLHVRCLAYFTNLFVWNRFCQMIPIPIVIIMKSISTYLYLVVFFSSSHYTVLHTTCNPSESFCSIPLI